MIIGVPKEVKDNEYRVALTPAGVRELASDGHTVLIENEAGSGSHISNDDFERVGARCGDVDAVWSDAELILKVKEPTPEEFDRLRPGLILFAYLHLAASAAVGNALLDSRSTGIAYETVQTQGGKLPLLAPMSEIAGRMAPHVGATALERAHGGRGILLGGVSGVNPAKVVVLGGGMAGANAAWIAAGMEGEVVVLDNNIEKLRYIDSIHRGRILTLMSNQTTIEESVLSADLVIGAVLVPGALAPNLISEALVKEMKPGAVIVDIAIDQGGCVETSRMTTHSDPTYLMHDIVHYCVGNMPGAVPHTSTYALTNATLPYVMQLANDGFETAVQRNEALAQGVNAFAGQITNEAVADALGAEFRPLHSLV